MKLLKRDRGKDTATRARRSHTSATVALLLLLLLCSFPPLHCDAVALSLRSTRIDSHTALTKTREGRLAVFDDVWQTIRDRYYDPSFHGIDWRACREEFRPLAAEARSAAEFYTVLRRMVGLLRDAHTRVYAPDEKFDWQHPHVISVGLSVREVGGEPVVVRVDEDSEAQRAGVRVGDIITSIDGQPALAVFTRRLSEQSGSSTVAAARLRAMATLFEGERDTKVTVGWRGDDDKERFASLRRQWLDRTALLRVRRVRAQIGVVEFDAFTQAVALDFMRALREKLRGVRGLVVDLRNNGGGEAEAMTEIASAFLPLGSSLGRFMDRTGRTAFEPQTRSAMLFAAEAVALLRVPVVILTSEKTSSAAEIFVATVRERNRAVVIGGPTCGCVLAIRRRHNLPDGGALDISEMDYRTATGKRLEGTGITPDEHVALDLTDLRARRDRAMERAIERLKIESRD
ncbi:MAG TPA: S41 family peptidase [Pyrinomonadaceae bacterium]|jgi:carboxyl-terminal processing protease